MRSQPWFLAMLTAVASAADWERIAAPDFSPTYDAVRDLSSGGRRICGLVVSRQAPSIADFPHVVEWDGSGWADLGLPDPSGFSYGAPVWTTLGVSPDGDLWLGGSVETIGVVNRGYAQPVFARHRGTEGWSVPVVSPLEPVVEYPYTQRGGVPRDIAFAPDGTGFAVGESGGWGGFSPQTSNPMWLKLGETGVWDELNVPDRAWPIPGRSILHHRGVVAFGADHAWSFTRNAAGGGSGLGIGWSGTSPLDELDTPADHDAADRFETYDIAAAGPDDVWVVGQRPLANPDGTPAGETLGFMHWNGSAWTMFPSPLGDTAFASCKAVAVRPDGEAWAAFDSRVPSAVFHFDGTAWEATPFVPVTAPEQRITIREMIVDDEGTVWAAGIEAVGPVPDIFANEPDTRVFHGFVARLEDRMPGFAARMSTAEGSTVSLSWPCREGYLYTIEQAPSPAGGWQGVAGSIDLPGEADGEMSVTLPRGSAGRGFWRVAERTEP